MGLPKYGRVQFMVIKRLARDDRGTLFSDTRKCLEGWGLWSTSPGSCFITLKKKQGSTRPTWLGMSWSRHNAKFNGTWRVPFGNFLSPSGTFGIHHVIIGILSHYSNPHGLYRRSSRTNPQVPSAQTDLLLHRPSPTLVSPAHASPSETATCWR